MKEYLERPDLVAQYDKPEDKEETKCCECNDLVDTEVEYYWSEVKGDYLCLSCYEGDSSHCSTVQIIGSESIDKFYIGDHIRMTEYGDPIDWVTDGNLKFDRKWVSSGGYRGHNETTIEGWDTVVEGWTTGGWDDPIARSKQVFNQWAEALLSEDLVPPTLVAIVSDPTSNVFSMGISVLVPSESKEAFITWLNEQEVTLEDLESSLS